MDSERIRCPEILFRPALIGEDLPGAHQLVYQSIIDTDIDLRTELFRNIVLSGKQNFLLKNCRAKRNPLHMILSAILNRIRLLMQEKFVSFIFIYQVKIIKITSGLLSKCYN